MGAGALGATHLPEIPDNRSFKEKVTSFTWEQAANPEQLEKFTKMLADEYLRLTGTNRLKKDDLIGLGKTNFFNNTAAYFNAIKSVEPDFKPGDSHWGYTFYANNQSFIDLSSLKKQTMEQTPKGLNPNQMAGRTLLEALWHEWGHKDVTEKTTGQFINNPQAQFYSPNSNKNEVFRKYRGGVVYTDTYYGYLRFDEVWNDTINARRMIEQVGLDFVVLAGDYNKNGTDFFPLFTSAVGVPLDLMYKMHAESDFEGFETLVGEKLPGNESATLKGARLFTGIHQSNRQMIEQSGALGLLPKR